jgi:hypothetical protein
VCVTLFFPYLIFKLKVYWGPRIGHYLHIMDLDPWFLVDDDFWLDFLMFENNKGRQ